MTKSNSNIITPDQSTKVQHSLNASVQDMNHLLQTCKRSTATQENNGLCASMQQAAWTLSLAAIRQINPHVVHTAPSAIVVGEAYKPKP